MTEKIEKICVWKEISKDTFKKKCGLDNDNLAKCRDKCMGYDIKCKSYHQYRVKYLEIEDEN